MTEFSKDQGIDKRGAWKARIAKIGGFFQRNRNIGNNRYALGQEPLPPVAWGQTNKFPLYADLTQAQQANRELVLKKFKRVKTTEPEVLNEPKSLGLSEKQILDLTQSANRYVTTKTDTDPEWTAPMDLSRYRLKISPEVGIHFEAHGMMRGTADNLHSLNTLLTTGIDSSRPFHTTVLRDYDDMEMAAVGIGAVGPFSTGDFILLGKPDVGIQAGGVDSVLVNEQHYASISELQTTFPTVHFIKAKDAPESLEKLLQEK